MRALSPSYGNIKARSEITPPVQFDMRVPLPRKKNMSITMRRRKRSPRRPTTQSPISTNNIICHQPSVQLSKLFIFRPTNRPGRKVTTPLSTKVTSLQPKIFTLPLPRREHWKVSNLETSLFSTHPLASSWEGWTRINRRAAWKHKFSSGILVLSAEEPPHHLSWEADLTPY